MARYQERRYRSLAEIEHSGVAQPYTNDSSMVTDAGDETVLYGVVVTYRRREQLSTTLAKIADQTRPPKVMYLVDNDPSKANAQAAADVYPGLRYLPMPENTGPAGGIAAGMRAILEEAHPDDWIISIDDDDPPRTRRFFEDLVGFAESLSDPRAAAVGLAGARLHRRTGVLSTVPTSQLHGAVAVDYLGGNMSPTFRVAAINEVGVFQDDLFFGFDDLEYGLRLRQAGYGVYAHGDLWRQFRERRITQGEYKRRRRTVTLNDPTWRDYYSRRNIIYILRRYGLTKAARRVSLVALGKPLINFPFHPRRSIRSLTLTARAVSDGWRARLGRTLEPDY